jgi:MerR family transcriptional regulator, light-induced transcriptional regulator
MGRLHAVADAGQPVMEQVSREVGLHSPRRGDSLLRRSAAMSLHENRRLSVQRTVEFEIVPRLLFAHRNQSRLMDRAKPAAIEPIEPDDVGAFVELVLGKSPDAAGAHVQVLVQKGVPLETIYLKLIAPAARNLKNKWLEDERDFAEVTLGLWRLQQVLREFSAAFRNDPQTATGLRALLTPGPSEPQDLGHVMFGLVLLGEFFRRDGWDTWIEPKAGSRELSETISNEWFDVVEFLANGETRLNELAASINALRTASLNRSLGIIVCGPRFFEHPELVLLVGGDMPAAADPRDGVSQAQNLVGAIASRA